MIALQEIPVIFKHVFFFLCIYFRRVKEAWESNREMVEKGGTLAIEQLSEALSSRAKSRGLSEETSRTSLELCAEQVKVI